MITVFERKPFGNEKIYEKRINIQNISLDEAKLQFNKNGQHLMLTFRADG